MSTNTKTPKLTTLNRRKVCGSNASEFETLSSIKKSKNKRKILKNLKAFTFNDATREIDKSTDMFDDESLNSINTCGGKRNSPLQDYNHQLFESTRISNFDTYCNVRKCNLKSVSCTPSEIVEKNKRKKLSMQWTVEVLDNSGSFQTSEILPTKNNKCHYNKMSNGQPQQFFDAEGRKEIKSECPPVIETSTDKNIHVCTKTRNSKRMCVLKNSQSKVLNGTFERNSCVNGKLSDSANFFDLNKKFEVEEPKGRSETVNESMKMRMYELEFKDDMIHSQIKNNFDMNRTFEVDQCEQDRDSNRSMADGFVDICEYPPIDVEKFVEKRRNTYEIKDNETEILNVTFELNGSKNDTNLNFSMSGVNSIVDKQVKVDFNKLPQEMEDSKNTFMSGEANEESHNEILQNHDVTEISRNKENFLPNRYMPITMPSITELDDECPFKQNYSDCCPTDSLEAKLICTTRENVKPCDLVINSVTKKTSSRKKMPNFALIHKRQFDRMEDIYQYSQRKSERARLLLSGSKPNSSGKKTDQLITKRQHVKCDKDLTKIFDQTNGLSAHTIVTLSPLQVKTPEGNTKRFPRGPVKFRDSHLNDVCSGNKKSPFKTNLQGMKQNELKVNTLVLRNAKIPSKTTDVKISGRSKIPTRIMPKLITKIPVECHELPTKMTRMIPEPKISSRYPINIEKGPHYTRLKTHKPTREEIKSIVSKTITVKNTAKERRDLIQGVRSNRRFDLLMKMRNK